MDNKGLYVFLRQKACSKLKIDTRETSKRVLNDSTPLGVRWNIVVAGLVLHF